MSLGVAEVDQQSVTLVLGDVAVKAGYGTRTYFLVATDDIAEVFGVKLLGKSSGALEIAEHHRELAAFGVGRICGRAMGFFG